MSAAAAPRRRRRGAGGADGASQLRRGGRPAGGGGGGAPRCGAGVGGARGGGGGGVGHSRRRRAAPPPRPPPRRAASAAAASPPSGTFTVPRASAGRPPWRPRPAPPDDVIAKAGSPRTSVTRRAGLRSGRPPRQPIRARRAARRGGGDRSVQLLRHLVYELDALSTAVRPAVGARAWRRRPPPSRRHRDRSPRRLRPRRRRHRCGTPARASASLSPSSGDAPKIVDAVDTPTRPRRCRTSPARHPLGPRLAQGGGGAAGGVWKKAVKETLGHSRRCRARRRRTCCRRASWRARARRVAAGRALGAADFLADSPAAAPAPRLERPRARRAAALVLAGAHRPRRRGSMCGRVVDNKFVRATPHARAL